MNTRFHIFILLGFLILPLHGQEMKIATYNLFFLDDSISAERKTNIQGVINTLDADIIAFQEIDNSAALENVLPADYQIAMIDEPEEILEPAMAVRKPFTVVNKKYVFPEEEFDYAFPRTRNLLQVTVSGYDREFIFLVHHSKSRRGGRIKTDLQRIDASKMILNYITAQLPDKQVILLGDFNDNPDDRSVNILETGDTTAAGGIDSFPDSFLFNSSEILLETDQCSFGYNKLYAGIDSVCFNTTVSGARAENNFWRNKEFDYNRDIKIKAILFDHILLSMNLRPYVTSSGVYHHSNAVKGKESKIRFTKKGLVYTFRGDFASDHVPVWTLLNFSPKTKNGK